MKPSLLPILLLISTFSLCLCSDDDEPVTQMNGLLLIKQDGPLLFDLDYNGKDPAIIAVGLVFLVGWSVFMIYVMCQQDWKFAETEEEKAKAAAATVPTTANTQNISAIQSKKLDTVASPTNKDKVKITTPTSKNGIPVTSPNNKSITKQTPKSSKKGSPKKSEATSPKKDINEHEITIEVKDENPETTDRRKKNTERSQPQNGEQVFYQYHSIDFLPQEVDSSSEAQEDTRAKSIDLGALGKERRNLEFEGIEGNEEQALQEVQEVQEVQEEEEEVEQPAKASRKEIYKQEKEIETKTEDDEPRRIIEKIEVKVHQGEPEEGWSYEKEWKLRKMRRRKESRESRGSRNNVSVTVDDASHNAIRLGTREHDLETEAPMGLQEALEQSINETNRDPHADMDASSCGFVSKSKMKK